MHMPDASKPWRRSTHEANAEKHIEGVVNRNENDYHFTMERSNNTQFRHDAPRRDPILIQDLMQNAREIEINHEGQIYRLRITRNRKLILTK